MPKNYEWVEGWSDVEWDTCCDNVDSLLLTASYHKVDWLNMGRILSGMGTTLRAEMGAVVQGSSF